MLRPDGEVRALEETRDLRMVAAANLPARREDLARAKAEIVRRVGS